MNRLFIYLIISLFFEGALAQVETNFSAGGAVRVGDSSTACSGAIEGAIRFDADGADTLDYCNGVTWLSLLTSSSSGDGHSLDADDGTPTDALYVDAAGNVGIGTTSPAHLLDIGDTNMRMWLSNTTNNTADPYNMGFGGGANDARRITMETLQGTRQAALQFGDGTTGETMFGVAYSSNSGSTWNPGFIVKIDGDVGIGTDNPDARFHVDGSGAGGGLCVTSDGTCSAVPTGGQISAETSLNTGADYAEYFEAEESLLPGDIVGLNPLTGKVGAYRKGHSLIGIVSTDPGVVGNSELSIDKNAVLVALVGQVPFSPNQVKIQQGKLFTLDNKQIGYLLANGKVYINLSTSKREEDLKQEISKLKKENEVIRNQIRQILRRLKQ